MKDLTKGSLINHLTKLALPSIGGMLAFTLFNITDTYFVGKLGTESLAAMGFTFPVVMIAGAISSGISNGSASVLARAAGEKNINKMRRTATDGILLSLLLVVLFSSIGLLTMDSLFSFLGAKNDTLPLIKSYMSIWYSCVLVVLMPPTCDSAMRAVGDTVRPFKVMLTCALLNIILDPIMIFGLLGFPAMGIRGAAIATIISRFFGMLLTLYYTHFHHKLITFNIPSFKDVFHSWKTILHIGVPSAGVSLLPQIIRMSLTSLAAYTGGTIAVAAIAAGSRIEGFTLTIAMAIGISIIPIIGQNFGAKKYSRVNQFRQILNKASLFIGLGMFITMIFVATPIIKLFTSDIAVINLTKDYLLLLTFSSIGLNLYNFTSQELNGIGLSKKAFKMNALGTLFIILPLLFIGSRFSFVYMIMGLSLGQLLLGIISVFYGKKYLFFNKTP